MAQLEATSRDASGALAAARQKRREADLDKRLAANRAYTYTDVPHVTTEEPYSGLARNFPVMAARLRESQSQRDQRLQRHESYLDEISAIPAMSGQALERSRLEERVRFAPRRR